ncbi:hypothetical protein P8C59_000920 [Phyllachora maydis]|uniref:Uncharacterized protein n=1 Tax=Phyllachora maydis TaxID=1825666 RepID=A0AAD9HXE9_9PEZI|nr:hypothetical protein P8C59_000920 [Phyllachora maydis]
MADQAKGKGIAPKRASNPADLGQSSRPLLPIRTLLEDKEDGEDYSKVIEVLKHISAIKNISSTLASLTNSSNTAAATTGKTSYSPRFDPFSVTIDLDSPPYPPRKEPHLGPAVNSATSNLDPPIDIGSKEGCKDTITSSIVKELSKKAYTILDDSTAAATPAEAANAAATKAAKPAKAAAVPATAADTAVTAKAATAKPAGAAAAATAVIDNINNAIPSIVFTLRAKAEAKAKEGEEEEDKEVVEEEKDVRGRGKEDEANLHIPSKGNSQVIA